MLLKSSIIATAMVCLSTMTVQAHVGLKTPCGRYQSAAGCPAPPSGQSIDYDINSPIGTKDSIKSPICKHTVPYDTRAKYQAGSTIKTEYTVGAAHGGGHCQWALSYDDGKTWVVIKTLIRDCLKGVSNGEAYSVPVQIPDDAPSGKATFQWIWNNAVGNREMYSNCADIEIVGGKKGGSLSGVAPLYANYGSGSVFIPEFPNPSDPDNHEAFDDRKSITVFAAGSSESGPSNPEMPPTTTKPVTSDPSTKPTPTTAEPENPTASPKPTGKPPRKPKQPKPTPTTAEPENPTASPKPTGKPPRKPKQPKPSRKPKQPKPSRKPKQPKPSKQPKQPEQPEPTGTPYP
ncbi:hypothetical protein BGX27_005012 [Mortierella sp. AM989]|nr:hypothetical protein BGX27_005012 [Mortierella sp. AM989]